jgi:hypothetical protein
VVPKLIDSSYSCFDARRFHRDAYFLERKSASDYESCTGFFAKANGRSYYFSISCSSFFEDEFTEPEPRIS